MRALHMTTEDELVVSVNQNKLVHETNSHLLMKVSRFVPVLFLWFSRFKQDHGEHNQKKIDRLLSSNKQHTLLWPRTTFKQNKSLVTNRDRLCHFEYYL